MCSKLNTYYMKKLLFPALIIALTATVAIAQDNHDNHERHDRVVKDETKTRHTSTAPQKVHNTFSKHKHYNGRRTTHKRVEEHTAR